MFYDNSTFYPTPIELIYKMLSKIELKNKQNILEPSAGKGNIIEVIEKRLGKEGMKYCNIDAIELDKNLVAILKSKGYRVIHDDFLTFNTFKHYDLIIMNPPFDNCDKHLLKAIELQKRNGGEIVCLLNAETIKNPYSNTRKDLLNQLDEYEADIEFIEDGFVEAERKTNVEIALVHIKIHQSKENGVIIDHLKQEEKYKKENTYSNEIISGNYIERVVQQYEFEAKTGVKLVNEYESLKPYMSKEFGKDTPILKLSIDGDRYDYLGGSLINKYIQKLRYKYWKTLFQSDIFHQLLTSDLFHQYMERLDELQHYDFSLYNIEQVQLDIKLALSDSIEDTILDLFDEFSREYSYWGTNCTNIHLYNGWKTNKCWKINDKKVIIPLNGYNSWNGGFYPTYYTVVEKLQDIEKVFNYLNGNRTIKHTNLRESLKQAEEEGQTKDIDTTYATLNFYKKGTCHIYWKNEDLVQKMNIIAAKNRNWLPPAYGTKEYKDMTKEEKSVIDDFQGEESYNEVMKNIDYYTLETSQLLALEG